MKRLVFGLVAGLFGLALPACGDTAAATGWVVGAGVTEPDEAGWRQVDPAHLFIFETSKGRVLIEAFPEVAPGHFAHFSKLISSGDLDGTPYHRVLDNFMAQGGDIRTMTGKEPRWPSIKGEFTFQRDVAVTPLEASIGPADSALSGLYKGLPLLTRPAFFAEMSANGKVESAVPHCRGIVSTARTSDPNSADTQFFLMRETSPQLDKKYTAWGRVIAGQDVVKAIKFGAEPSGTVTDPDILISAKVAADLPEAKRPKAWVLRTDTPEFAAELAAMGDVEVCSLPPVPAIVKG